MWKTGCASLGVASMAKTIWDLRFMNAAMAGNHSTIIRMLKRAGAR